jgi:hypothetical protein
LATFPTCPPHSVDVPRILSKCTRPARTGPWVVDRYKTIYLPIHLNKPGLWQVAALETPYLDVAVRQWVAMIRCTGLAPWEIEFPFPH